MKHFPKETINVFLTKQTELQKENTFPYIKKRLFAFMKIKKNKHETESQPIRLGTPLFVLL